MKAALVGAVQLNAAHLKDSLGGCGLVVAVDKGWESCKSAGVEPDVAVGDFDSLGYVPTAREVVSFPSVKDESDMELALQLARQRGADDILLYGAFSDRVDHTLANIECMAAYCREGMRLVGVGSDFALSVLAAGTGVSAAAPAALAFDAFDPEALTGSYAPYFSAFPIGGTVDGVCFSGVAYPLENAMLSPYRTLTLSNRFIGQEARLSVKDGVLLVVFPLDALLHAHY